MPLYPPSDPSLTFEPATLPEGFSENPVPREGPRPSFGQTLGAGFAIDNEVLGAIKAIDHETNFGDVDPNHNPWEQIQGTELEPYGDAFLGSRNQKNTDYIAGAIRDEIRNRRILEASHPLAAFAASGIASIASPTTLIPGGVVYRGLKIGRAAAKSALAVGAANAAAAGVQEAILHRQQYTRTGTESAFAVGGSFLLAALLGGAASGLSSRAFRNLTRKLETDLQISTALQNEVEAIKMGQAAQSAGAAAVAKPPADLKSAFGLEKLDLLGPSGRGMNSEFPSMRELTAETAELPTMTTRNDMGVTTAPRGGAIETRIKTQGDAKLGDAVTIADDAWKQYRFGKINPSFSERIGALGSKPPGKLTEKEFRQEMGKALVRNDEHPIPEIQKGVREIRKNVIQPIAEDAIKLKKLDVVEVTKNLPNWLKHELKPQSAAAAPKIDPNVRSNLETMLSRVEEMTGQKIDQKLRDQALAALAENEDLARRLREVFTGEPDIPFALRDRPVGRRLDDIVDDLENGHPVALDRDFTETMHGALRDVRHGLPDAARQVPMHYMVGVEPIGDGNVDVSFSGLDGGFFRLALPLDQFRVARAAEVNGVVLTFKSDFVGGVDQVLVGEIKHELAHALRRRGVIGDDVFNRLVSHSESLGVLDMPLRDFLAQTTGDATRVVGGESIRSAYTRIYMESNFSGAVIEAKLKEEALAHMAELRAHGKLTDEQLGPVLADMDDLFGRPVPAGQARAAAVADWIEQLRGAIKVDPDGGVMFAMRDMALRDGARIENGLAIFDEILENPSKRDLMGLLRTVAKYRNPNSKDVLRFIFTYRTDKFVIQDAAAGTHFTMGDYPVSGGWIGADGTAYLRRVGPDDDITFDVKQKFLRDITGKDPVLLTQREFENLNQASSANIMFALRDLSRRLDAPLVDDLGKSDLHPGRVMAVHGTKAQPFDQFDPTKSADFGIHFGTRDQADIPAGYTTTRENARMIPVVLDLKTVVDVPDMMTWPPVEVAQAVEKAYPLASGLTERVKRAIAQGTTETGPTGSVRPSREALAAGKEELRRLMTEAKIDGLRYWNDSEGEGWSYIVWDEGKVTSATSGEPMMGVNPDGAPQFATAATNPVAEQPHFPDHAVRSVADQIAGATQQSASVSRSADGAVDAVRMGDSTYRVVRGEDGSVQGITVDPQGQLDFSAPVVDDAGITAIAKGIQAIVERAGGPPLDDAIVKGVVGDIVSAIGKGENPVQAVRTSLARVMPQMMLATRGDDILRVVRQLGGIRDETGDLAAMGAGERRGLISEQGLSPDAMRQHMIDRGFLQDVPYEDVTQSSVNDLYDLIREALGDQSGGQRVYREEMAHQALKAAQKIIDDNGLGIKLTPDQEDQLVKMILDRRMSPDDAVERLGMMGEDVKSSAQQNTDPMRDINARRIMQDISDLLDDGSRDDVFSSEVADEVWGDGAESYGPRVWDRPRVIAKRPDVKGIIADYFQEAQGRAQGLLARMMRDMKKLEADAVVAGKPPKIPVDMVKDIEGLQHFTSLSRMDLESTADQVIDHILGLQDGRMMMELPKAVRGSLKARTLRIPDLFESANGRIEDFFDRDINVMMRQYVRSTVPDLEIVRRFGKLTLEDQFARIGDDFKRMVERLNLTSEQRASMTPDQIAKHDIMAERERKRLDRARRNAERDLTGMISRLRGERMDHMDPTAISTRTLRGFRQWNLITMLGGMTVSAIPDIFRPMMVHGVKSYFMDGLRPLLTNISAVKKAGSEIKTFGTALDLELGTRLHAFSDVVDDYGRYSKFERGLGYATEKFGILSLMNGWNASLKRVAGMMAMTNAVRMAQKVANGTATKADIRTLAAAGIDAFDARTVAQQFAMHGTIEGGVYLPNSKSWDVSDPNVRMALDSFKGAIVRDVDRSIVTPGQEKPLFMSTEVGATLLQFKTFGFASFQRTLIAGLQQRDSGVLLGAVLSVGMGMAVEYLKALMNDKPLPKTEAQWIAAGLDRSGLLAYISDANNLLEKGSGGTLGIGALTGKELSRYASRNAMDALMGPSVGRGADIFAVTSGFSRALAGKDQVRESDIATFRRLIPFQNLFYLSYIFQKLEQAVSKGIGAKPSKHRSPLMDRLSSNDNWLDELVSVG